MDIRYSVNQKDVKRYTTEELRSEFLIQDLYEQTKLSQCILILIVWSPLDACQPQRQFQSTREWTAGKTLVLIIFWNAVNWAFSTLAGKAVLRRTE